MGANLFQQYLQPARSVMDYMGDMDAQDLRRAQLEGAQRQNALAALVARQQAEQMQQAQASRNKLAEVAGRWGGQTTPEQRIADLRNSGDVAGFAQADTLEKQWLDRQKAESENKDKSADTAKKTFDLMTSRLNFIGNTIGSVTDARKYAVWKQALTAGGFDVSQFPAEYDPEAVATIGQMTLTMKDRLEQAAKDRKFGLEAANEVMTPDGKGGYRQNDPLIAAKSQIANAGKTSVSINTGQKGYENESKLRNDFKSEPIYKDYEDMKASYKQIMAGLDAKSPIGDVAAATKMMKLLDPGSVVRESELAIAMAASGKLDRLQNYLQMKISGESLTPTQRKDFAALATELHKAAGESFNKKRAEYEQMGSRYGLEPSVLGGKYEPTSSKPATPKPSAAGLTPEEQSELEALRAWKASKGK
jgi:hypothetical protein